MSLTNFIWIAAFLLLLLLYLSSLRTDETVGLRCCGVPICIIQSFTPFFFLDRSLLFLPVRWTGNEQWKNSSYIPPLRSVCLLWLVRAVVFKQVTYYVYRMGSIIFDYDYCRKLNYVRASRDKHWIIFIILWMTLEHLECQEYQADIDTSTFE